MNLPTGNVTFLFTDIEGSTRLWESAPASMRAALERHDAILTGSINDHQGHLVKSTGDGVFAVFAGAAEAIQTALRAQTLLCAEPWPEDAPVKVRIAIHSGHAQERDADYFGPEVNRAARLVAIAHGGQTLVSAAAFGLASDSLPERAELASLGEHRLRDMAELEHVYQLKHPDLPSEFAPLLTAESPNLPNNLPIQLTAFIGREHELESIMRLLEAGRLVTLSGPGGCGKTRIALQCALELLQEYPDGVWLIELAGLNDGALVASAAAAALKLREEPGVPAAESIVRHIGAKRMMLLLDNCEHLAVECARFARATLQSCAGLTILASSREPLAIPGEAIYRVPPLAVPAAADAADPDGMARIESVRLFVDRAAFAQPGLNVNPSNAGAIAQICRQLDGIPLALELAAACARSMTIEQIAERLHDRFRLLKRGSRVAEPRQQTLRALIDWSYDLLSPAERSLVARLSVFADGWTADAAEQVCAGGDLDALDVSDLITGLIDKSLVLSDSHSGDTRYRYLQTIRQYAAEKLEEEGEDAEFRRRHFDYYLQLVTEANVGLTGPEQGRWMGRLTAELDNLRAASAWCREDGDRAESGLRLAGGLAKYWDAHGMLSEGKAVLARAIEMAPDTVDRAALAAAKHGAAVMAVRLGEHDAAARNYQECLAIRREVGPPLELAITIANIGNFTALKGDLHAAAVMIAEALQMFRDLKYDRGAAFALSMLGNYAADCNELDLAAERYAESLTLMRRQGELRGLAYTLQSMGTLQALRGEHEAAVALYEECIPIQRDIEDLRGMAYSMDGLAGELCVLGDLKRAREVLTASLTAFLGFGEMRPVAYGLLAMAHLCVQERNYEAGATSIGAAFALNERFQIPLHPRRQTQFDEVKEALKSALGSERFDAAFAQGTSLSAEDAVGVALSAAQDAADEESRDGVSVL